MRKVKVDGKTCIGPSQSSGELKYLQNIVRENEYELLSLSELLAIAGDKTRLKILFLLSLEKRLCVCDISEILGMNVSAISHQLKKLKLHRLVKSERQGKTIYYSLVKNKFTKCLLELFEIVKEVSAEVENKSIFLK